MKNIGGIVKAMQDIMWKDPGVSGDAQRIEQLGWMIFLKIMDDKDKEMEVMNKKFTSVIPKKLQWRAWAENKEGITGDELKEFVDNKLFPQLRNLDVSGAYSRALLVKEVFSGTNNYMKSGTLLRQVINKLDDIDFNSTEDRHVFGEIYETILKSLQSAGSYGEFYTPRAITEFMTEMTKPSLSEKILDPACGTGGFLTSAIEYIRAKEIKNAKDIKKLEENIHGMELKPLPFMLCATNLILHDMENPNVEYTNTLNRQYSDIGAKDRVDVILANPPFGASVEDGIENNFPAHLRTRETADLFLVYMARILKDGGRAAIVLPDGSLTGDGVKQRIREHFLKECNLHTIVRLPNSVFQPYASVATNLLFFEKGKPTKDIWYWEHKLPEGVKAYNKTRPIQKAEFENLRKWWKKREETEFAWKVSVKDIEANGWNLDIKNPHTPEEEKPHTTKELIGLLNESLKKSAQLLEQIKTELK